MVVGLIQVDDHAEKDFEDMQTKIRSQVELKGKKKNLFQEVLFDAAKWLASSKGCLAFFVSNDHLQDPIIALKVEDSG